MHLDHIADLLALRFALAYNPVSPPGPVPLVLPPGGRALLERLAAVFAGQSDAAAYFGAVFAISEFDPAAELVLSGLRLTFLPTVHFVPCWAIRIASEDASSGDLTYTADSGPAADLAHFAHNTRVLIAEATYIEPPETPFEERGHLTAGEAGTIATAAEASILVLSHLWEELGFELYRASAGRHFTGRLEVARPGLHLEW
jgi:ribonuclease BN (tRNA processing enzyme)